MKFTLTIESGNAQMQTAHEVADAVSVVVRRIIAGDEGGSIRDINGNTVGHFDLVHDEEELE